MSSQGKSSETGATTGASDAPGTPETKVLAPPSASVSELVPTLDPVLRGALLRSGLQSQEFGEYVHRIHALKAKQLGRV